MLANALLAFVAAWADGNLALGVVYFALLGLLALLLLTHPHGFVALMGRGVAVAFLIALAVLTLLTFAGMAVTAQRYSMVAELMWGSITLAIQLLLLSVLTPKDVDRRVFAMTTGLAGAVALVLLIGAVFVVEVAGVLLRGVLR